MNVPIRVLGVVLASCLAAASSIGQVVPRLGGVQDKMYRDETLYVREVHERIGELPVELAAQLRRELSALGVAETRGFYDSRTGRWSSMILRVPLLPGEGHGNDLKWPDGAAPRHEGEIKERVWDAVRRYLFSRRELRLDMTQVEPAPRIGVFEGGRFIVVHRRARRRRHPRARQLRHRDDQPRQPDPSRCSELGRHGRAARALRLARAGAGRGPRLRPALHGHALREAAAPRAHPVDRGGRIGYRLAWVVLARVAGDVGLWESLIDASTGELISFEDRNQYNQRRAIGGVYPVSNDQRVPDGVEQVGWPMPYTDINAGGVTRYTDSGGSFGCIPGSIQTSLSGLFVKINDNCGAVDETSASGDLDLGSGPAAASTDCTVPAGHSAGDTKSSRTGFYELNRIKEQAAGT
jgi:hypothetical protein